MLANSVLVYCTSLECLIYCHLASLLSVVAAGCCLIGACHLDAYSETWLLLVAGVGMLGVGLTWF